MNATVPPRRRRSPVPPLALLLALSGAMTGCESEASRRVRETREATERRQAEVEPPSPQALEQVRGAATRFLGERHPGLEVEGLTLTSLTPNAYLVAASVKDKAKGNRWVSQLTAERLRADGDTEADLAWILDYAEEGKLQKLADRHGFGHEVSRIASQPQGSSWGHRSFLDNLLLWHVLFNRPSPFGWSPMGGFSPMARGFRPHDPARPVRHEDLERFRGAAAPTGGRSSVFLGGQAWRPPTAGQVGALHGDVYPVGRSGALGARTHLGTVTRGGFGATGRGAAFGAGS